MRVCKILKVTEDMRGTAERAAKWISPLWYYSLTKDLSVILARGNVDIHFNGPKTRVYVDGVWLKKRALVRLADSIRDDYNIVIE